MMGVVLAVNIVTVLILGQYLKESKSTQDAFLAYFGIIVNLIALIYHFVEAAQ